MIFAIGFFLAQIQGPECVNTYCSPDLSICWVEEDVCNNDE